MMGPTLADLRIDLEVDDGGRLVAVWQWVDVLVGGDSQTMKIGVDHYVDYDRISLS